MRWRTTTTGNKYFDTDPVGRKAHGAIGHRIKQDHDDPNHFMLSIGFHSVEEAEGFLSEPALKQSWDVSGVGEAWLLVETETVTY
jgi:hypothetical protein